MLKEFKQFALKGNVLDLAVAVIIGAAFGKIVSSVVNDIIMPPLGLLFGHVDFSNLFIALNGNHYPTLAAAKAAGAPTLNYGLFLSSVIDFTLIAFCIFLIVQQVNRWTAEKPAAPTTKECPECAMMIPVKARRCPHCTAALAT